MKRIAAATAAILGACSTNSKLCTHALQPTPPFPQTPRGPGRERRKRMPSRIRYLDDGYYTQEPDTFDLGSSVEISEEIRLDRPNGATRKVQAKVETNACYSLSREYSLDPGYSLAPGYTADTSSPKEAAPQRLRKPTKRRNRLAPRTMGTAILPTYIGNARKKSRTLKSSSFSLPSTELLTFEDEKEIAGHIRSFRAAMRARDKLAEWMSTEVHRVGANQLLEPSEFQWASACSLSVEQLHDIMNMGQEARTKLITGNVGLVTMIAKRYYGMLRSGGTGQSHGGGVGGTDATLKMDDLIQEGYMGIMEAAERYDPSRGFRFSTYATHWIRQRIVRSIADSSRMIRLPVHVQTKIRNMRKKHKEIEGQIGRSPSLPELAHELGVPLDKVHLYQHLSRAVLSLENPVDKHSAEDKRTLGDRIACKEFSTPDEDAMSEALRGEVHAMLDGLDHKERIVLTHRFGLEDGQPKSLRETAEDLGISSDSVRAVEAKALNKLRQPRMNYRLKDYVRGMGELDVPMAMEDHHYHHHHSHTTRINNYNYNTNGERNDEDGGNDRPTPESIWSF